MIMNDCAVYTKRINFSTCATVRYQEAISICIQRWNYAMWNVIFMKLKEHPNTRFFVHGTYSTLLFDFCSTFTR